MTISNDYKGHNSVFLLSNSTDEFVKGHENGYSYFLLMETLISFVDFSFFVDFFGGIQKNLEESQFLSVNF